MVKNGRVLIVIAVILILIVLPLISYYFLKQGEKVRTQRRVPSYSLYTTSGDSLSSEDLRGSVYVADFVYTRCPYVCDQLNKNLAALQEEFKNRNDFKIVTVTIDPEHDSLPLLKEYAEKYNADPDQWYFATGDRRKIYDLILGGFFGRVQYGEGTPETIQADQKIVLIGRQGYIKGYYEEDELEELQEAVRKLLEE